MQLSITSDLDGIENVWRCFEQRAECTPFQTFDWLSAYQHCIGRPEEVKPAIVTGRQGNGELLFILPLAIERARLGRRCVFLGHTVCDYNAPLLASEFPCVVAPAEFAKWWRNIETFIQETPGYHYDIVWLDKMPERIGQQANPMLALATRFNSNRGYRARLGKDWDSFYTAKRSPTTRSKDRRKQRRLEEHGELRIVTQNNPKEREWALRILFDQKSRSFARTGVPNPFAKSDRADFYQAAAAKAGSLVHISRLDVGSTCLAANLGLLFRGCYYYLLTSYDDGPLKRYGPGELHLRELIRYAISQELRYFDFTIGEHAFKLEWTDEEAKLYDRIAAASWLGLPAAADLVLRPQAKQLLKKSQLLEQLMRRSKSVVNSLKSPIRWRSST